MVDQREVEELEQKHCEQAISQLERFVGDKVLVSRRERTSLAQKVRAARQRRDDVVGSTGRDRVEAEILRLSERDEALEQRIQALDSREDEVYRRTIEGSVAKRAGTSDEVGAVGALLTGPDGGFITGSDFLMDGGVTAAY